MAEDYAQEVFQNLWKALPTDPDLRSWLGRDPSHPRKWLWACVKNKKIDHWRKSHVGQKHTPQGPQYLDDWPPVDLCEARNGTQDHLKSASLNPEDECLLNEAVNNAGQCLNLLSPVRRAALLLQYGQGLSVKDIAVLLGKPEDMIQYSILQVAHREFQGLLAGRLRLAGIERNTLRGILEHLIERQVPANGPCPPREDLLRGRQDKLAPPQQTAFLEHLALCRLCQQAILD